MEGADAPSWISSTPAPSACSSPKTWKNLKSGGEPAPSLALLLDEVSIAASRLWQEGESSTQRSSCPYLHPVLMKREPLRRPAPLSLAERDVDPARLVTSEGLNLKPSLEFGLYTR